MSKICLLSLLPLCCLVSPRRYHPAFSSFSSRVLLPAAGHLSPYIWSSTRTPSFSTLTLGQHPPRNEQVNWNPRRDQFGDFLCLLACQAPSQSQFARSPVYDSLLVPPPCPHPPTLVNPLSCLGVIVIVSITPAIGHVIALGTNRTTDLTIDHTVDLAIAGIIVAIGIAVPPVIIRAIPLVVGHIVVPGVAGVHTGLLGIGPGVSLGLAPTGIVLMRALVIMILDIIRLRLLFPLRLL